MEESQAVQRRFQWPWRGILQGPRSCLIVADADESSNLLRVEDPQMAGVDFVDKTHRSSA